MATSEAPHSDLGLPVVTPKPTGMDIVFEDPIVLQHILWIVVGAVGAPRRRSWSATQNAHPNTICRRWRHFTLMWRHIDAEFEGFDLLDLGKTTEKTGRTCLATLCDTVSAIP